MTPSEWEKYRLVLNDLARRQQGINDGEWYHVAYHFATPTSDGKLVRTCCLCKSEFSNGDILAAEEAIHEHGMRHLKDHNLLPFI